MFEDMALCLMQSDLDRKRLLEIGLGPQRVKTAGNIKFDRDWLPMTVKEKREWLGLLKLQNEDTIWVAGSTHQGEETIILDTFGRLRPLFPGLRLIIAPRKTERTEDINELSLGRGFNTVLKTQIEETSRPYEVLILNTLGELDRIYGLCEISFVGGSMVPIGGHNLLEPASFGIPVLFGPHTHNFVLMSQLLIEAGGGKRVEDGDELFETVKELLSDPDKAERMGRKAHRFVETNRGALNRVMDQIQTYL